MKIRMISLEVIQRYENNPRNNEEAVEHVANSIQQFGFRQPIVIDADNVIVAGHTRYKAAQRLGMPEVPCVIADDLTPEQIKAYRLADNKTAEIASWDYVALEEEINALTDIDMSAFGFDADELLAGLHEDIALCEEDDFEIEIPEHPVSQQGDIWRLGRHRLMCGDAADKNAVKRLLDGQGADMYLTDPPYGVDYEGKTADRLKIQNDTLNREQLLDLLTKAFAAADGIMKDGAAFYIWHADSHRYDFLTACMRAGWEIRQCLIWVKNAMVLGRQDYHWRHEPCLYGWKDGTAHLWAADRSQTTVLEFDKPQRNGDHPTMKPVQLFDYLIRNNTKAGDIVYDGFAGSGTSIIACEYNGRSGYGMEIDPKYCDVIVNRWEALTGEGAERLSV